MFRNCFSLKFCSMYYLTLGLLIHKKKGPTYFFQDHSSIWNSECLKQKKSTKYDIAGQRAMYPIRCKFHYHYFPCRGKQEQRAVLAFSSNASSFSGMMAQDLHQSPTHIVEVPYGINTCLEYMCLFSDESDGLSLVFMLAKKRVC